MSTCTCEGQGQQLVEVFGVRFRPGDDAPAGTVSVFDGKRGQIIYSSGAALDKPSSQTQRSGGRLPLTGPYRAISADGCVSIVLDLHHRSHDAASSSSSSDVYQEIFLDVYDENTRYGEAITSEVSSTCGDGRVEVTYALLSDAAEAIVEVRILHPGASGTVTGTVVARTNLGEVVLFNDDGATVGTGAEEEPAGVIPLARSVVAVPLTSDLTIELDLVVNSGDGCEVVNESVVCVPKIRGDDVHPRSIVEVKITWLD